MPTTKNATPRSNNTGADWSLYSALLSHYLHQDRLVWDMAQLIIVVQSGVLVTSFALRASWMGPAILLSGCVLTFVILLLVLKAEVDRDTNLLLMDEIAVKLLPPAIVKYLKANGKSQPYVRMSGTPPKWMRKIRGRYVIRGIFVFFMIVDLNFAGIMVWVKHLLP